MFLNASDFPFTALLESRWHEVRREFEQLPADQLMSWPETDLYNNGWEVFGFWAMGKRLNENCALCPRTAALINTVPGMTTAGLSLLAPGTRIRPHVGYTNSVLRCHLGIDVPEHCGLQVAGETRNWQEGKCLVFDDTALHSAWNESGSPRIVLLIDFLREGCKLDSTIPPEVDAVIRAKTSEAG